MEIIGSSGTSNTVPSIECWENQRYVLFKGWGPYRLPTDRPLWSNRKGDHRQHVESMLLPTGWIWSSEWFIQSAVSAATTNGQQVTDPKADFGWLYAPDFTVPTKYCSTKSSPITLVRRRKWMRLIRNIDVGLDADTLSQSSFWVQCVFCGLAPEVADTTATEAEQRRHHESFHRLSRFARNKAFQSLHIGLVSSVPMIFEEDDDALHMTAHSTPKVVCYTYRYGVASCLRGEMWRLWAMRAGFDVDALCNSFTGMSAIASQNHESTDAIEIDQDVVRTAPRHPMFDGRSSIGQQRLRSVLRTVAISPDVSFGYHQAFSYVAAMMLLHMPPAECFALVLFVLQDLLPLGYHEQYLLKDDIHILCDVLKQQFSQLDSQFHARQIDISAFAVGWLQGLFCAHFPFSTAARLFDIMFVEGNHTIMVRVIVAFFRVHESFLLTIDSSCSLGQFANQWARSQFDIQPLLDIALEDKTTHSFVLRQREYYRSNRH